MRVQLVSLEGPLELAEVLAILVQLGFQLFQLRELRSLVILRWWVRLSVVPRCPGIPSSSRSSGAGDGILRIVHGDHGSVDIEAFPSRVIAIGL